MGKDKSAWRAISMERQVFLTRQDAQRIFQRQRDAHLAVDKILSPVRRGQEGNLECIHCGGRFNGVTETAWKFGLCDDCLER